MKISKYENAVRRRIKIVATNDGTIIAIEMRDNSRQRVGVVGEYRLAPGKELIIKAPHGVTGSVRAREVLPDGKLRKKSRNKVVK